MHVVLYTDAGTYGGAEQSLGNLLAELPAECRVTVVGTHKAVVALVAARRAGSPCVVLPPVLDKRDVRGIITHVRTIRRLRPDIVHVSLHTPWSGQYAIFAGLITRGVRVVAVEQLPIASDSAAQRWIKRTVSRRLAAHVAVGDSSARLIESIVGLEPGSVGTVYNGVPEFTADPLKRSNHSPVVGSLGRLTDQKGYDVLVRALADVPEARGVIVGEGPARRKLEALANELGVADRLELIGWREDARRWLASFDVFVLPSRYEGFPLSIIEAMLAGTPVVASDVASVSEAIIDGSTGVLVRPDDVRGLARALRDLLADESRRRSLADAARQLARDEFTSAAMTRRFTEIYSEVLAGR